MPDAPFFVKKHTKMKTDSIYHELLRSLTFWIPLAVVFGALTIMSAWNYQEVSESPNVEHSAVQLLMQQRQDELSDWQQLILAIAFTESRFNPDAVGSASDIGILQITEPYVKEVNRIYGTEFSLTDAFSIEKSLEMYELLQSHYNKEKDIDKAIYFHNKSPQYRRCVLDNLELIQRYENLREYIKTR